jgi:hypothetical protein
LVDRINICLIFYDKETQGIPNVEWQSNIKIDRIYVSGSRCLELDDIQFYPGPVPSLSRDQKWGRLSGFQIIKIQDAKFSLEIVLFVLSGPRPRSVAHEYASSVYQPTSFFRDSGRRAWTAGAGLPGASLQLPKTMVANNVDEFYVVIVAIGTNLAKGRR